MDSCELCGRKQPLTFHHLIPRCVHSTKRFQRKFTREQMQTGLYLCNLCHDGIHDLVPNEKVLAENFFTKELLLSHEPLQKHLGWVRKQK